MNELVVKFYVTCRRGCDKDIFFGTFMGNLTVLECTE